MNKKVLINNIVTYLQNELSTLQTAANNAHLAAIDEQSIAETQYDTLAIEAGYLAEGQSRRVIEIKLALQQFNDLVNSLDTLTFDEDSAITQGALIQLQRDEEANHWLFLAPAAAGYKTTLKTKDGIHKVTVITEQSPMGEALSGLYEEDGVTVLRGSSTLSDVIISVC